MKLAPAQLAAIEEAGEFLNVVTPGASRDFSLHPPRQPSRVYFFLNALI